MFKKFCVLFVCLLSFGAFKVDASWQVLIEEALGNKDHSCIKGGYQYSIVFPNVNEGSKLCPTNLGLDHDLEIASEEEFRKFMGEEGAVNIGPYLYHQESVYLTNLDGFNLSDDVERVDVFYVFNSNNNQSIYIAVARKKVEPLMEE